MVDKMEIWSKNLKILYHGSHINIQDDYLTPQISFDYKPLVYATDNPWYTLVRCGKFNPEEISIKEDYIDSSHKYTLVELRENAFKDIFDTDGYIYYVNAEDFKYNGYEYVSVKPVKIQIKLYVDNVWEKMQGYMGKIAYELIEFKDSDRYFEQRGIDKNAYLKRRNARIEKLREQKMTSEQIKEEIAKELAEKGENNFVKEVYKHRIEDPAQILNWYRNLYYKEGNDTERGVMANAINDFFIKYKYERKW